MKIAIIGTGIAGLGCAYFLHPHFDVTLFEQNDYIGGHTNTVVVSESSTQVPIDTGFMVYNEVTYPNLTRLFKELKLPVKPTSMSFSVQHIPTGLEFCGSSLNHLFGQRKNILSLRFWRMLQKINRFNAEAIQALNDPAFKSYTLREYVAERQYGEDFLRFYLIPMSSAVWSTPPDTMLEFPVVTLLRFFHNHGFLGLHTQHPWLTVVNGAKSYVAKITAPFLGQIKLNHKVTSVVRAESKVILRTESDSVEYFDKVIFASHGDQTLRMLADATPEEHRWLSQFQYQPNSAWLHTDESVMPKTKLCWASWNYRNDYDSKGTLIPSTIYWMNSLQGVSDQQNYFVSINGEHTVNPEKVLRCIDYEHPIFTLGAIEAQQELPKLNQQSPNQPIYFCGSYFKYGFHEDAFTSAVHLCQIILGRPAWN